MNQQRKLANHDGLTGLLNKRYFIAELCEMVVNSEREAQELALFIFDIDHFKNYNDTNGHPAGDDLLKSLAGLLIDTMRPSDLCCRYGGEEFLVVLPQTDGKTAMAVAERIRAAIEEHPFKHQENQPGKNLTISGGVAVFPEHGDGHEVLIVSADKALYESKAAGRNRVALYRNVELSRSEDEPEIELQPARQEA